MIQERDYQQAAIESIFTYFETNCGYPIVAMPTGTGKSVVIAGFIRRALSIYPGTRVLKVTHVKEIIVQNHAKLLEVWPTAPVGVYSSSLKKKQVSAPIIFAGIASIIKCSMESLGRIDLLLIDECHLLSPKEATMYRKLIQKLKAINPYLKVIGFTATPYRLGQGMLTEGEDRLFTDICFDLTTMVAFNWLLEEGYLAWLIPKKTNFEYDISGVRTLGGDFHQGELQQAVNKRDLTIQACNEMIEEGIDRKHWLIFAAGIEHTIDTCNILIELGIPTTCVHSEMADEERDKRILDFKAGVCQAMVNNGILTTGFDFPAVDLIGVLRHTKSTNLWVQILGRGTRPFFAPGYNLSTREGRLSAMQASSKQFCLVMDFAANSRRLGTINNPVMPKAKGKGGGGEAPVKLCEWCPTYNHPSVRFCINCGAEFPVHVKIKQTAATDELISKPEEIITELFKVDNITYNVKRNFNTGKVYLNVSYICGLRSFSEPICFGYEGYAGKVARDWWRERSKLEIPATANEAILDISTLKAPTEIRVWLRAPKEKDKILSYEGIV